MNQSGFHGMSATGFVDVVQFGVLLKGMSCDPVILDFSDDFAMLDW